MRISKISRTIAGAATAAALLAGGVSSAQAQSLIPGVTSCGAPGGKQQGGAIIGGLLGGLLGNSVSGHNRTTGTVLGAAAGAAAGSAVGCKMQHNDQSQTARAYEQPYRTTTYSQGGYRLSSAIRPASYRRVGETFVATTPVILRSAPTTGSGRVGSLRAGERFQALAKVRGTDWILVGQDGVGVGYVHGAYAQPAGYRYAYGY
ncbi:MAG: SH3 domain-containing protein [Phenylobacterium sp.]